jgi:hypothetical protein
MRKGCLKPMLEGIPGMALHVYPSDVTDGEWAILVPLLPLAKRCQACSACGCQRLLKGQFPLGMTGSKLVTTHSNR